MYGLQGIPTHTKPAALPAGVLGWSGDSGVLAFAGQGGSSSGAPRESAVFEPSSVKSATLWSKGQKCSLLVHGGWT